ncbi:MAG: heme peroxidase family protein, partial [Actinomycetota bacterium]
GAMMRDKTSAPSKQVSRRSFLGGVGVAGAAAAASSIAAPLVHAGSANASPGPMCAHAGASSFGRLFPSLPPFAIDSPQLRAALLDIGRLGGMLDAKDDLAAGPVRLITDPTLSLVNRNNPTHTAGVTFMGQFIDHDITFDAASKLGVATPPESARNFRTPMLDLESVYGLGPVAQSELYNPRDSILLDLESGGSFEDLPRRADGSAIVGDPRNDSNIIISGLHAAFCAFHNAAVARLRTAGSDPMDVFLEARRLTTWHYQWLVVNQFLPLFVGRQLVDDVLRRGARFYHPHGAASFIPVEFSGAAYRFGHSMVRPSYRANLAGDGGHPFFGLVFDATGATTPSGEPQDLRGGFRSSRRFVGWQTFFDFGDGAVRPNKRVDTIISTPLFQLPASAIAHLPGTDPGPIALPQRTLLRHLTWSLPSGQAVAARMGLPQLASNDLADLAAYDLGLERNTPLWFYVLREAAVMRDGLTLGPVGGRIVAETLIGLLKADPASYLSVEPRWAPSLGGSADYDITNFLTFAGVDPTSRGQ